MTINHDHDTSAPDHRSQFAQVRPMSSWHSALIVLMEETAPLGLAAMASIPKIPTHCGRCGRFMRSDVRSNSINSYGEKSDPHSGMVFSMVWYWLWPDVPSLWRIGTPSLIHCFSRQRLATVSASTTIPRSMWRNRIALWTSVLPMQKAMSGEGNSRHGA